MSLIRKLTELERQLSESQAALEETRRDRERLENSSRHLNFLDNAVDGYLFTDERDNLLFINSYLLQKLGYSQADRGLLHGQPLPPRHWHDSLEWELLRTDLLQQEAVHDRKVLLTALDGTPLLFKITGVLTQNHLGRVVGAQYTLRLQPYTNRQSTAELRAENRELAALTAIGRNVLSTMDVNVVVQHLLHTVRALFNVETVWVLLKERDGALRLAAHAGLSRADTPAVEAEAPAYFALCSDGERRGPYFFGRSGPLPDSLPFAQRLGFLKLALAPLVTQDQMVGLLVVASRTQRFITTSDLPALERVTQYAALALSNALLYHDLQRAYEDLKLAQERLVEAERQRVAVEMAGAAAHELNQPLTVLLGYSNLLVRNLGEDDPQRATLEAIERNSRKISEIVARLGNITRYRTTEYLDGQGIVDIDAASQMHD